MLSGSQSRIQDKVRSFVGPLRPPRKSIENFDVRVEGDLRPHIVVSHVKAHKELLSSAGPLVPPQPTAAEDLLDVTIPPNWFSHASFGVSLVEPCVQLTRPQVGVVMCTRSGRVYGGGNINSLIGGPLVASGHYESSDGMRSWASVNSRWLDFLSNPGIKSEFQRLPPWEGVGMAAIPGKELANQLERLIRRIGPNSYRSLVTLFRSKELVSCKLGFCLLGSDCVVDLEDEAVCYVKLTLYWRAKDYDRTPGPF